jgi:hypothetical protein|tara:strand:+ start:93 stop:317 length:225 start_codon:yes stop_codon:yes gene_type:complete
MHSTQVTNFTEGNKFATVEITMGREGDQHITASISKHGSEVTLFFNSPAEIRQFASDLLTQASTGREMYDETSN